MRWRSTGWSTTAAPCWVAVDMPRLGVPVDIVRVVATFRQPQAKLNPLGLRFVTPIQIVVERTAEGAATWRVVWPPSTDPMLPQRSLIPLLRQVCVLFEQQVSPWEAYNYDGAHQSLIDAEIKRQLREYGQRYPAQQPIAC